MAEQRKLEDLRSDMAWAVISAITRGEKLDGAMQTCFDLVTHWQRERVDGGETDPLLADMVSARKLLRRWMDGYAWSLSYIPPGTIRDPHGRNEPYCVTINRDGQSRSARSHASFTDAVTRLGQT